MKTLRKNNINLDFKQKLSQAFPEQQLDSILQEFSRTRCPHRATKKDVQEQHLENLTLIETVCYRYTNRAILTFLRSEVFRTVLLTAVPTLLK